jgi:hypothetical protein
MDLLVFIYNYTHEITSSTLQLFSCLLTFLRLTASQLRLNVSHITLLVCKLLSSLYLLGSTMNLEESIVSRPLVSLTLTFMPGELLVFYYLRPTMYRKPNSRGQFLVSVVTVCLCTHCLGNVHEPLPNQIGNSLSGCAILAFRRCLSSCCLAVDACL